MAKSKDLHSHAQVSILTDGILTGAYFLLVAYTIYVFSIKYDDGIDVWWFLAFCGLVLLAIRLTELCTRVIFRDIISKKILNTGPIPDPLAPEHTFSKFVATCWQFVIHFTATGFECYLLWDEPWLSHTYTCFLPVSYTPKHPLRLFYILQLAIWIVTCFSHRFNSDAHAHKDYVMMYVHHLTTIALVAISYHYDQTRVGLIVLFIHDCSDIGIDLLKMSNYLSVDGPGNFFLVELAYAATMTMWFYFRLWYFPVYVLWYGTLWGMGLNGASINGHLPSLVVLLSTQEDQTMFWVGVVCSSLLSLLLIMHIWWFFLLARIFLRMVTEDNLKTIANEEYEGDQLDVAAKDKKSGSKTTPPANNASAKKVD